MDLLAYIMYPNVLCTLASNIGPAKPDNISTGFGFGKAARLVFIHIPVRSYEG